MTDLIVGMGEVGSTLYALFTSKHINVIGIDENQELCRGNIVDQSIEILHVCFPYSEDFNSFVSSLSKKYYPNYIMIHSTVPFGTARKINSMVKNPVISSPIRGVHSRFLEDVIRYTKFYALSKDLPDFVDLLRLRFDKICRLSNYETAEMAKLLVDTTYYGLLIAYRKFVDSKIKDLEINSDELWKFADEIQEFLKNRPVMFNDKKAIGGHCIVPNLDFLDKSFIDVITFIKKYSDLID